MVFALDGTTYVKRCVAVPGDTVMVRGGVTSVNGVSVPLPEHARRSDPRGHPPIPDVGPLRVPRRGDRMKADRATGLFLLRMIERDGHVAGVTGSGGLLVDGIPADAYTVQDDQYFMLGDNRDNSLDSRLEGFVPASGIIGKAMMVYWSRGSGEGGEASGGIRWARLGRIVR